MRHSALVGSSTRPSIGRATGAARWSGSTAAELPIGLGILTRVITKVAALNVIAALETFIAHAQRVRRCRGCVANLPQKLV